MNTVDCLDFLIADRTFREDNGKMGLLGIFSTINYPTFPTGPISFSIYCNLQNMDTSRSHELTFNLSHDESHLVVLSTSMPLNFVDPPVEFMNVEIGNMLPPVVFVKPGKYTLMLSVDGHNLASRAMQANLISPPQT